MAPSPMLRALGAAIPPLASSSTSTLSPPTSKTLRARQSSSTAFVAIPSTYSGLGSSPHPGVVAGIVLGSVAGFLLLLYLIYCIIHGGPVMIPLGSKGRRSSFTSTTGPPISVLGGGGAGGSDTFTASSAPRQHRHQRNKPSHSSRSRSRRHSSSRGSVRGPETVHIRRSTIVEPPRPRPPPPAAAAPARPPAPSSLSSWDSRSRSPSPSSVSRTRPPPPRAMPVSDLSGLSTDDEIVVMEEHSPPRRPSGRYRRDSPDYHARPGHRY